MTLTGRFLALLSLFALVSVTSTAVSSEGGEKFASATIYVVPLNVITRVPMTVDAVVSSPTFLIRIDDSVYATRLWKMIAIDTFKLTRTTYSRRGANRDRPEASRRLGGSALRE